MSKPVIVPTPRGAVSWSLAPMLALIVLVVTDSVAAAPLLLNAAADSSSASKFICATLLAKGQTATGHSPKGAPPPPTSALGEKRLLLYRVDFSNFVGAAIASNTAAALLTNLGNYYRDMSYGLMTIAPVGAGSAVTDTLRLPLGSSAYDNNFTKLITDVRQAATDAGYAPEGFDYDIVFTGAQPGAVFGGISYVGGPGMWIPNGNFNLGVVGHEFGHNLGLPHASLWYTGDQSVMGPGVMQEYGDLFDTMGTPGGSTSHFNARFKNLLGWIPDADAPVAATNGMYRIMAHDQPGATGARALRIARNAARDYWVEFRQSFTNLWVTNGAGLRVGGHGATNTLLLDTTPGTPNAAKDSPILIGRTFSDPCLDIHITPVGKGGTVPESLDVVVNRGPFPGNLPPGLILTPSATAVATGAVVTLQAIAVDPNGDALAYFWDFGDGNFGPNQPTVQYAWGKDGAYVARCTVSDMKGGTASASVVMQVGTVANYMVSGRVLQHGLPMEGVLVKAGTARFSYTDSDGSFRISQVKAGRQTMTAVFDRYNIFNAGFENPITVGPDAVGLDFGALPDSLNAITLVATGSVWKYLDTGMAPPSDWTALDFDDAAWKSGPARLGYGVGGEGTMVGYGTNASNRYLTTWFRRAFTVEYAALIDHLVFRLRRDDGAVVYLNGIEVYRENLPAGPITPATTALGDVNAGEEQVFFKRLARATGLVSGTNLLAVEIHQVSTNSVDLSFDLELAGLAENPTALRPVLSWERAGTNLVLSWPAAYGGWQPVAAPALAAATWSVAGVPAPPTNGLSRLTQSATNGNAFYQLHKPGFCEALP